LRKSASEVQVNQPDMARTRKLLGSPRFDSFAEEILGNDMEMHELGY
jgi:hypothetical protein